MSKKPAVAAKAAPRTRTIKARPKVEFPLKSIKNPVDWEKLAKQLQGALAAEMKDNELQQDIIDQLVTELARSRTLFERFICLFTGHV